MLSMLEWWLCLVMSKDEIEHIARFKELNPEQKNLLLAARKAPGQYTEGVVIADSNDHFIPQRPAALGLGLGDDGKR